MILIVEDDRMLMMGLQVALKTKGSQVLQAGSVREALSVYDQQAGSIDFVLLDMWNRHGGLQAYQTQVICTDHLSDSV